MKKPKTEILIFGRRLHNALRKSIEDGDGRTDDDWTKTERPIYEHYSCGLYLTGTFSFIEGKLGTRSWHKPGKNHADFNSFLLSLKGEHKTNPMVSGVSEEGLDALVCIRNAITHNNNDLTKNNDTTCLSKVTNAKIPGVTVVQGIVTLTSNNTVDCMEYMRRSFIAVTMYHDYLM